MFWSLELGTELRRALNRANTDHQLGNRVWRQLNQAFPDNLKNLHPKVPIGLPDADDEHVAQLASQFQCELVTFNLRDFPAELLKPIVVRHPDEYFLDLFYSVYFSLFFDVDNNDDRSFILEDEMDQS